MGNNIITCLSKENEQENTEEKIDAVIDNVWREIDKSINKYQKKYEGLRNNTEKTHGWRVVRLFISSTFADFHAEREVLIKKVSVVLWEWIVYYVCRIFRKTNILTPSYAHVRVLIKS